MNNVIRKYWEDQGKQIHFEDESGDKAAHYYYNHGNKRIWVAVMYEGDWAYMINDLWYREHDAIKLIKR